MSDNLMRYERSGFVATITINRPNSLNAMTKAMLETFRDFAERADTDDDVRVVVFTGVGRGFCAGYDINEFRTTPDLNGIWRTARILNSTWSYVRRMSKPTIAAINGATAGAGFELSLCCDLRIAKRSARIGSCEVRINQPTTNGSSYMLAKLIGESKAKELCLTGDIWSAETCERFGLVNAVADDETFDDTVREWAERIASRAPMAVRLTKGFFEEGRLMTPDSVISLEEEAAIDCYLSDDMQEGFAAFLEGRDPIWLDR